MDIYNEIVQGLREALIGEHTAVAFYSQLLDISQTYSSVEAFAEARRDEQCHADAITLLLASLTGEISDETSQPVVPPSFKDYREGLLIAIAGEKNGFMEYSRLLEISPYTNVNEVLEEIRRDEEVHLLKFIKLYEIESESRPNSETSLIESN